MRKFTWIAALIVAGGACGFFIYGKASPQYLLCRLAFDYYLIKDSGEIRDEVNSGLSSTYYFTSYYLNGILSAAEGTGSEHLLRVAMRYMDAMIATAEEYEDHGRKYKAWRPFTVDTTSMLPRPNLHFTLQATVPLARAAAIIMTHPEWKAKYGGAARRYIEFTDQSIIQYWYHSKLHDQIPWINPDLFPLWNDNASNLALNTTFLYQATGDPGYLDVSLKIGRYFRKKIRPYKTGWIWENQTIPLLSDTDNTPGSVGNLAGVPDTSHANREAFLMVAFHEAGILYTRADLERMAGTFTDTLWNQSVESPSFANYINGSDKAYRVYKEPGLNGSIYHGWTFTGGYSRKAQQVLVNTIKAVLKQKTNPSLERNVASYGGRLGLCGHTLRNFRLLAEQEQLSAPPVPADTKIQAPVKHRAKPVRKKHRLA